MAGVGRKFGGRSGGQNRKALRLHELQGTRPGWRAPVVPMPQKPAAPVAIPESGAVFLAQMREAYGNWSPSELVTLQAAATQVDRIHALRIAIGETVTVTSRRGTPSPSQLLRAERAAMTTFAALIKSLRLIEGE